MRITEIRLTDKEFKRRDYCDLYAIEIDGEKVFCVCDGEAEDNTIGRNFNDVFGLVKLLKRVHEAGLKGEAMITEQKQVEEY